MVIFKVPVSDSTAALLREQCDRSGFNESIMIAALVNQMVDSLELSGMFDLDHKEEIRLFKEMCGGQSLVELGDKSNG